MGGKKKLNLKQMERMQDKKDAEDKGKKKEKTGAGPKEKKPSAVVPPDAKNEKIIAELKKMHVLTPYVVSTRYNIRISAAKEFLQQLQENGKIQLVSGNHNLKIYKVD
ncbi:40S ribosomal protein S25 [Candidatus Bathyarchaeota archaeon]|nr:40S ribosomal protein S25 [Candidatus Bathyarchaeota archaeon]